MSYLRIQTTIKKANKNPKRKNARQTTKRYKYVYEIEARRGRVKGKQHRTRCKRHQAVIHEVKQRLGPLVAFDQRSNNRLDIGKLLDLNKDTMLKTILISNLRAYGFKEKSGPLYERDHLQVDLKLLRVWDKEKKRNVVLQIYEGFVCTLTLQRLFVFDLKTEADLPALVKVVRDVGLLPFDLPEKHQDNLHQPKNRVFTELNQILLLLIEKYPNFKAVAKGRHDEPLQTMSFAQWQKENEY